VPLLLLALLEIGLRIGGYGYSTSLFEKAQINGKEYLLNNEKFSLRFFPPELARWPNPVMLEPQKPPNTCRIFIFGESAAQGDPEPPFGAGRYLEVLLRERYPEVNFEVVNVAFTAINSHVIVPIARECARYGGDLWIIYMGNNEMIGPFGAATVFGAKAPPWPVVRLVLALQETRVGQLLMDVSRKIKSHAAGKPAAWGGLEMFMGNQLAPDNPAREVVYKNFQRNLQDIIRAGRDSSAHVLLSTVAVNLKDCPPFASVNSSALSPPDRGQFDKLLADGRGAQLAGDWKTGAGDFEKAITLDPKMAEAQFREGQCLLQLNDIKNAGDHLQTACDDDALVFRADSRINDIIRDTGKQLAGPDLVLCDAAAGFGPVSGDESFYEHVHFNFDGNYRLGLSWAEQAEALLPAEVKNKGKSNWAAQEICEVRLGLTDWNRADVFSAVRDRMGRAPLNTQFNNNERIAALNEKISAILHQRNPQTTAAARALYEDAITRAPQDYILHENYGEFLEVTGESKEAALQWRQARVLMPRDPFAFLTEGQLWEQQGNVADARDCFQQAVALHPRYAEAWLELGKLDANAGNLSQALETYRRAASLQPDSAPVYILMGKAYSLSKQTDLAVQNFRHAMELDPNNWEAHYALGGELGMHDQIAAAREQFEQVVRLQPQFPMGHLNLGVALLKFNDPQGAREQFAETLRLDPSNEAARSYLSAIGR
jgi:tetratricopeptide (TPR) repeat protein